MVLGVLKRLAEMWSAWQSDRYDPAKHYMRGPGPKCELKRAGATHGMPSAAGAESLT